MTLADRHRVEAAFNCAEEYSTNAGIQRPIAQRLASRIAKLDLPQSPRILEIGCGTGFLTQELMGQGLGGDWLITDKAPSMVDRCRKTVGEAAARSFATLDGEYGMADHKGHYDLICASMAMQWFDDLPAAVSRLLENLRPGGHLLFNTLASGTFKEWREAHHDTGQGDGAISFPTIASLRDMMAKFGPVEFSVEHLPESHSNAREFLTRLKLMGAATARRDHRPLTPAALKQVMARFDDLGSHVTYEVVTCHIIKGTH